MSNNWNLHGCCYSNTLLLGIHKLQLHNNRNISGHLHLLDISGLCSDDKRRRLKRSVSGFSLAGGMLLALDLVVGADILTTILENAKIQIFIRILCP